MVQSCSADALRPCESSSFRSIGVSSCRDFCVADGTFLPPTDRRQEPMCVSCVLLFTRRTETLRGVKAPMPGRVLNPNAPTSRSSNTII